MFFHNRTVLVVFLSVFIGLVNTVPAEAQEETEWLQALEPMRWTFSRDHGAHPAYRTEWWYFTGNLSDDSGSPYGFQLTFFRQGIRKQVENTDNAWSVRDIYLAHFTITDVKNNSFEAAERISRAGPGLAGARTDNLEVWLFDWSATMKDSTIILAAKHEGMELKLTLKPKKPLVFHGENGLSKKGEADGQASYYTSFTDLETTGILRTHQDGALIPVKGTSWFDHEFGSNQLRENQEGWDWFSLHLSDGRDLMIYLLRKKDGSTELASSGTLVEPEGASQHLRLPDISVSVLDRWKSSRSGGKYPRRWKVSVPSGSINVVIESAIADQELNTEGSTGIIYWEGAVTGKGTSGNQEVSCEGYVELTGYAGSLGGIF